MIGSVRTLPPVRWRRLVVAGVAYVLLLTGLAAVVQRATGGTFGGAWVNGAFCGVLVAVGDVVVTLRQRKRLLRAAPKSLTSEQLQEAVTASHHGPVPTDPLVRAEAARLARLDVARLEGRPAWLLPAFLGGLALVVGVMALFTSSWWLAFAGFFILAAVTTLRGGRRSAQRLRALQGDPATRPLPTGPRLYRSDC